MSQHVVKLNVEGTTPAASNQQTLRLYDSINNNSIKTGVMDQIDHSIEKNRTDTQDFGSTLVLIFGTPAAIAIAKGIHDFIAKSGDRVVITCKEGTIVATGSAASNINIAETVKNLQSC